jgi:hypothetical protein
MATFGENTIGGKCIAEMQAQGYKYAGFTTGQFSLRKGSNLYRKVTTLGLSIENVAVRRGAKMRHRTQGTQLLIFVKAE